MSCRRAFRRCNTTSARRFGPSRQTAATSLSRGSSGEFRKPLSASVSPSDRSIAMATTYLLCQLASRIDRLDQSPTSVICPNVSPCSLNTGRSSTPRLIGSIIDVSGILGHPPSRVTTTECEVRVLATHCARGLHLHLPSSKIRGRREDRVLAAPAVSRAICANKSCTRAYRAAGTLRPSLRNGFTAYFVLFPENGSFASVVGGKLCFSRT